MWSFSKTGRWSFAPASVLFGLVLILSGCQFQPLHGNQSASQPAATTLATVDVGVVNSRVGQQVRNHLLFLLTGGQPAADKTHEARLRVTWNNRQLAAIEGTRDNVSGTITVSVSYDLVDLATGDTIASGARQAEAFYDRTGQVFANRRAERDAENRAAREAAESIRFAIASDLSGS